MTHDIIKTENYLLVVDDLEIREGDWIYESDSNTVNIAGKGYHNFTQSDAKIIAHLPLNNSPVLEGVPLLPPLKDEAESLSLKSVNKRGYTTDDYQDGFEDGYNKAKEKYKYTEEDLTRAFNIGINSQFESTELKLNKDESFDRHSKNLLKLIQSLQQPEMPFGFECEWTTKQMPEFHQDEPKTTTNSQGQTVLVGKYIY